MVLTMAKRFVRFRPQVQADPKCAMAHWESRSPVEPHINLPLVPPPAAELA